MRRWMHWIFGVVVSLSLSSWVHAQPPAIDIQLSFDKPYYRYGESVGVSVVVSNQSGSEILINQGFGGTVFYKEMRILDPANRLLAVFREGPRVESPDAPPLPVIFRSGGYIRVIGWESLPAGWETSSATADLRSFYPLELPGYYSAQVQVSAMTFKPEDPGNIHNYAWQGVLQSDTVYFYVNGATPVDVVPPWWRKAWQSGKPILPDLTVLIWPQQGKSVDQYQRDSIRLNNVPAKLVVKLYSFLKKQYYLLAFFDTRSAVNSLGPVQVGQEYPVVISGKLTSDQFFGGGDKIKIIP